MGGTGTLVEPLALWTPAIYIAWCVLVFALGLFFGSFFNVCIYRVPLGLSVNRPKRSFCFRCGTMISWFQNLPIISYLALRGKCGHCGAEYSPRYAIVELLTGLVFLAIFMTFNPLQAEVFQFATFWYLAFASLLIVGTFTDIDHWIIPDGVSLGGAAAALVAAALIGLLDDFPLLTLFGPFPLMRIEWDEDVITQIIHIMQGPIRMDVGYDQIYWWEPLLNGILGAIFGAGMLYGIGALVKIFLRKEAMGMGDVKLFALVGGTLGITGSVLTFVIACFYGSIAGLLPIIIGKIRDATRDEMPERVLDMGAAIELTPPGEEADEAAHRVDKLVEIGRGFPRSRPVHHLPFGPWIALAAITVLIFNEQLRGMLAQWFLF